MQFLDTKRQRAALLIIVLGLGLAYALWPFITGLMGALVLYVVFTPVLPRACAARAQPGLAAGIVVLFALVLVVGPGVSFIGLVANQAQAMAQGVLQSPLLVRLRALRVGPYDIGAQIETLGSQIVSWAGSSALSVVGTATRIGIQLTISFFGLFYLLVAPGGRVAGVRPFIPFSAAERRGAAHPLPRRDLLDPHRHRADRGGAGTAGGRRVLGGRPRERRVLGGGDHHRRHPAGGGQRARSGARAPRRWRSRAGTGGRSRWRSGGSLVVGNVDNVIRPYVFRRWARIHPFITVIGAFAGISWFGLLGLLIGPLAISYFFELIRMYRAEYLEEEDGLPA